MPISTSKNKWVGITLGDPAGIGPEIVAKALSKSTIKGKGYYKIIGDRVLFKKYNLKESNRCVLVDCQNFSNLRQIKKGVTKRNGRAAFNYLKKAVLLLKSDDIGALVTAPVSKEAIALNKANFVGHTEYLAKSFHKKHVDMMFVQNNFRVVIASRHIPLKKVSQVINKKNISETICQTHAALKNRFKIRSPRIAICGMNPHAGESGLLGKEEQKVIIPVIKKLKRKNIKIEGPFAADTIFTPNNRSRYDCIIALYHDQGLTPAKTLYFDTLVNLTLGLPFIRTSPDHGTGFDIAGKNRANPSSMVEAIKLAAKLN